MQMEQIIRDLQDEKVLEIYRSIPMGKMLRSKLILYIAPVAEAIRISAIIELIHMASLLHDDVIDEADTRRGKPSVNAVLGNKPAIMIGDILYSKAFYELTSLPGTIARTISQAVALLSLGELKDVELSKRFHPDIEAYMDMIYKKTASLIEASAISAAYLSGKDMKSYGEYGKKLGLAFQIVDDILDITSDEETLGKPVLNDFYEGKTTLPYIYLYEALDIEEKEKLKNLYKKRLEEEEKEWLLDRFESTGAIEKSKEFARRLGYEAMQAIPKQEQKLQEIMEALIERTY